MTTPRSGWQASLTVSGPHNSHAEICLCKAEALLAAWAQLAGCRDDVVRAAHRAGITKSRIHEVTGLARTTIDRIIAGQPGPDLYNSGHGSAAAGPRDGRGKAGADGRPAMV